MSILRRLPHPARTSWLPPVFLLFALLCSLAIFLFSIFRIRAILDNAVLTPVDAEAEAALPKIDTQSLDLLRTHLE